MKLVCIKNRDDGGGVPWTKENHYHKLKVGVIYEGDFITDSRGRWVYIQEFNHKFATPWWFVTLEEWREKQLKELGIC